MVMRSQPSIKLAAAFLLGGCSCVQAGVSVSASGNQALANISLSDGVHTYIADVTITFDNPINLTPDELNLSAQLVDAGSISARLPACLLPLLGCTTMDPAFPVMITVEPLNLPWLFANGFDANGPPTSNLSFLNTYEFEIHTSDLNYVSASAYRLFKAPVNGTFSDVTDDVLAGSVRARGRGGSFSQFMIIKDMRASLAVELLKEADLDTRILGAALNSTLSGQLLGLLAEMQTAVGLADYATAIANLDELVATIQAHAGVDIANVWSSDHTLVNDAGDTLGLAQTLRFTLVRLQNGL